MTPQAPEPSSPRRSQAAREAREFVIAPVICRRLGISRWTWRRWVRDGHAPAPIGGLPGWPKWRARDIDRFASGSFCGPVTRAYFTRARQWRDAHITRVGGPR